MTAQHHTQVRAHKAICHPTVKSGQLPRPWKPCLRCRGSSSPGLSYFPKPFWIPLPFHYMFPRRFHELSLQSIFCVCCDGSMITALFNFILSPVPHCSFWGRNNSRSSFGFHIVEASSISPWLHTDFPPWIKSILFFPYFEWSIHFVSLRLHLLKASFCRMPTSDSSLQFRNIYLTALDKLVIFCNFVELRGWEDYSELYDYLQNTSGKAGDTFLADLYSAEVWNSLQMVLHLRRGFRTLTFSKYLL